MSSFQGGYKKLNRGEKFIELKTAQGVFQDMDENKSRKEAYELAKKLGFPTPRRVIWNPSRRDLPRSHRNI